MPTFRGAGASGLFIEEEEDPSKRVRGMAWNQIETAGAAMVSTI